MVGLLKTRRGPNTVWVAAIHTVFLLSLLCIAFAGSAKAEDPPQNGPGLSVSRAQQFAVADFDADDRPDLASVEFGRSGPQNYAINFRLTSGPRQSIDIAAPEGGLQLRAQDVNGDSFPDVVITTFWTDRPVAVLLNDGRGNFTRAEPSAFPGTFEKSENSLTFGDNNKADAIAALFSRYSPEPWEEDGCTASPLSVVGRSAGVSLRIVASPTGYSWLGRAPPLVAVHS